jgi:hypothetical protein
LKLIRDAKNKKKLPKNMDLSICKKDKKFALSVTQEICRHSQLKNIMQKDPQKELDG